MSEREFVREDHTRRTAPRFERLEDLEREITAARTLAEDVRKHPYGKGAFTNAEVKPQHRRSR